MPGEYVCMETGGDENHNTFYETYAERAGLPYHECEGGNRVCVGVGTGILSQIHVMVLTTYGEAHNLPTSTSDEPCEEA